jgi:hypothetical protein
MDDNQIHLNEDKKQFELDVNGELAIINYRLEGKVYSLIHTEVPPAHEGQGVGRKLVENTLNYIKEKGYQFEPLCSFVAAYVKRHPEWESSMAGH